MPPAPNRCPTPARAAAAGISGLVSDDNAPDDLGAPRMKGGAGQRDGLLGGDPQADERVQHAEQHGDFGGPGGDGQPVPGEEGGDEGGDESALLGMEWGKPVLDEDDGGGGMGMGKGRKGNLRR